MNYIHNINTKMSYFRAQLSCPVRKTKYLAGQLDCPAKPIQALVQAPSLLYHLLRELTAESIRFAALFPRVWLLERAFFVR